MEQGQELFANESLASFGERHAMLYWAFEGKLYESIGLYKSYALNRNLFFIGMGNSHKLNITDKMSLSPLGVFKVEKF
jgi:hypothetical protein